MILGNPYVLGAAAVFAFLSGWTVNNWRHDARLKEAQDRVRAEEQVKLDDLRLSLDAANSERLSLAADLAAEKSKLKIKYRTITQEVPIYAAQNSETCNYDLDPGLVRLLNTAAAGSAVYSRSETSSTGQLPGSVSASATNSAGDTIRQPD